MSNSIYHGVQLIEPSVKFLRVTAVPIQYLLISLIVLETFKTLKVRLINYKYKLYTISIYLAIAVQPLRIFQTIFANFANRLSISAGVGFTVIKSLYTFYKYSLCFSVDYFFSQTAYLKATFQ